MKQKNKDKNTPICSFYFGQTIGKSHQPNIKSLQRGTESHQPDIKSHQRGTESHQLSIKSLQLGIKSHQPNKKELQRDKSYHSNPNSQQTGKMTRRHFLTVASLAVISGALITTQPYAWAGNAVSKPQQASKISHMNAYEYGVLKHLMDIAIPVAGTPLPQPNKIAAMTTLDQVLLAGMEPHILAELKMGIQFFDQGPRKNFQNKNFTQLSSPEAVEFCDQWADSDSPQERGIVMGLKKLVALSYWSNPATWPNLGYIGPISKRKGIPALGNAPLPIS